MFLFNVWFFVSLAEFPAEHWISEMCRKCSQFFLIPNQNKPAGVLWISMEAEDVFDTKKKTGKKTKQNRPCFFFWGCFVFVCTKTSFWVRRFFQRRSMQLSVRLCVWTPHACRRGFVDVELSSRQLSKRFICLAFYKRKIHQDKKTDRAGKKLHLNRKSAHLWLKQFLVCKICCFFKKRTSDPVKKLVFVHEALTSARSQTWFCWGRGARRAACHGVTLRGPCFPPGFVSTGWSEVSSKWWERLSGQDPLTLGRSWRKAGREAVSGGWRRRGWKMFWTHLKHLQWFLCIFDNFKAFLSFIDFIFSQ